jgi:hypothetical protein
LSIEGAGVAVADDLPQVVDAIGHASAATQVSEGCEGAVLVEEGMGDPIAVVAIADDLAAEVDGSGDGGGASEVAQVGEGVAGSLSL